MSTDIPISEFDKESVSSRVTTSGPQIENGNVGVSVLDILIMVADRKRSVFLVTAALTLASLLLSFLLPPRYTAGVAILPPQQGSSAAAVLAGQLGNASIASLAGGALGLKNPSDMFVGMLKSRTIEDAMVHHFGLMQEYGKDGLIHVTVWDRDPNRAAELANGYVD
jgi:tyrosine-protein kinase Etk/Wzc